MFYFHNNTHEILYKYNHDSGHHLHNQNLKSSGDKLTMAFNNVASSALSVKIYFFVAFLSLAILLTSGI